jgi:hypothetical protein
MLLAGSQADGRIPSAVPTHCSCWEGQQAVDPGKDGVQVVLTVQVVSEVLLLGSGLFCFTLHLFTDQALDGLPKYPCLCQWHTSV